MIELVVVTTILTILSQSPVANDNAVILFQDVNPIEEIIERELGEVFVDIARAESGLDPNAYNPERHRGCKGSWGLFQIACLHYEGNPKDLFDVELNIKLAKEVYEKQGFKAWSVCKKIVVCE